jgi:hypothetical protein
MTMINGLPAHALLVHIVAVLIPVASVLLVVVALWPAARRHLSVHTAVVAGVALVSVPITTGAGDWLEHHVAPSPLVRAHTHLGDTMLPWAIGLFVLAAAVAVREVRGAGSRARASGPGDHPGAALAPASTPPRGAVRAPRFTPAPGAVSESPTEPSGSGSPRWRWSWRSARRSPCTASVTRVPARPGPGISANKPIHRAPVSAQGRARPAKMLV